MASSDELRKRIEALNRKQLSGDKKKVPDLSGLKGRLRKSRKTKEARSDEGPPSSDPKPAPPPSQPMTIHRPAMPVPSSQKPDSREDKELFGTDVHIALEDKGEGEEAATGSGGKLYLVERSPGEAEGEFPSLDESLTKALVRTDTRLAPELERSEVTDELTPDDLVFFDLETTGLGSSPLFLIGAMVWEDGRLVTKQFFARDYTEERGVLEMFLDVAEKKKLLVSFNGKSFDVPFVRMRAGYHGLPCSLQQSHLDLLHTARRIWKGRLPDCKLQTLEQFICGRWRTGDIPGSLIPDAYHDYVRTRNAARMISVLRHNYLDLVTLAEIIIRMPVAE